MIVFIENQTGETFGFRGYRKLIEKAVETTALMEGIPSELEVNIMIVDKKTIRQINRKMRGVDRITDVLSFPYLEFDIPGSFDLEINEAETILGDIVVCADKVISQAEQFGHSRKRELAYLVVHSMLHLAGYDHISKNDEERMTKEADLIMEALGISRS